MAASLPSISSANARVSYLIKGRNNIPKGLRVIKVQSFQEEGRSASKVDANLSVLKERMEMVKVKERLERCCRSQHGWNYDSVCDHPLQLKRSKALSNLIDVTGLVCGTLSCTCLSGTLFLCLISLVVHLQL